MQFERGQLPLLLCVYVLAGTAHGLSIRMDSYYGLVNEDIPLGTLLVNFTVTGDVLNVSVYPMDDDTRRFVRLSHTGNIYSALLNTPLDRETANSHDFRFRAADKDGNTRTAPFKLYVNDVNDNAPVFEGLPYTFYISERSVNYSTGRIFARDRDSGKNGDVQYNLMDSQYSSNTSLLHIDPNTGVLTLRRTLDYETNTFYEYLVTAQDLGTPPLTSTATVIIHVLDVQDTPPFFTRPYYRVLYQEEQDNLDIIQVNAVDGDIGVPNNINYSIANSNCPGLFVINSSSGHIQATQKIDRESTVIRHAENVCRLGIVAVEIPGTSMQNGNTTCTTNVIIVILDVDDNAPEFDRPIYNGTLMIGSPPGTAVQLNGANNTPSIYVTDLDQNYTAGIELYLRESDSWSLVHYFQGLKVEPSRIFKSGAVTIRVTDRMNYTQCQHNNTVWKLNITASVSWRPAAYAIIYIRCINAYQIQPTTGQVNTSSCPVPSGLLHGHVGVTDPARVEGSLAVYACEKGRYLWGNSTRRCAWWREWEGQAPTCERYPFGSGGNSTYPTYITYSNYGHNATTPSTTASPICGHGALSVDHTGSTHCLCEPGYVGLHCNQDYDECRHTQCENSGTCINTDGSYRCACPTGYSGIDCTLLDCRDTPGFSCWEMVLLKLCNDPRVVSECPRSCNKCSSMSSMPSGPGPAFIG